MYRILNVGLMAATAVLLLSVQAAWAQADHLAQATDHAQQAATHGGMGHAEILVQHATMALTHAELAGDENPYAVAAAASLQEAITHGNMGHAEIATGRVSQGVTHLQVAVHVGMAMDHGKQAVSHGGMGHATLVITHAELALTHAQAAAELSDSPHIALSIQGLQSAINHAGIGQTEINNGRRGRGEASIGRATTSAQEALNHLGM